MRICTKRLLFALTILFCTASMVAAQNLFSTTPEDESHLTYREKTELHKRQRLEAESRIAESGLTYREKTELHKQQSIDAAQKREEKYWADIEASRQQRILNRQFGPELLKQAQAQAEAQAAQPVRPAQAIQPNKPQQPAVTTSKPTSDGNLGTFSKDKYSGAIRYSDSNGKREGYSQPSASTNPNSPSFETFDKNNSYTGTVRSNRMQEDKATGNVRYWDKSGVYQGYAKPNLTGGMNVYDGNNKYIGTKFGNLPDNKSPIGSKGASSPSSSQPPSSLQGKYK